MKRILPLIALVVVIPICGYLVCLHVEFDSGQKLRSATNYSLSETNTEVQVVKYLSLLTLFAGLALLLAIYLGARYASSSRSRLANIFSPGFELLLLSLFCLILMHGGIVLFSTIALQSIKVKLIPDRFMFLICLGALVGSFTMVRAGLSSKKRISISVIGKSVTEEDQPQLWNFVKEIAERLGAIQPKNIVIGLEPTFYVSNALVTGGKRSEKA